MANKYGLGKGLGALIPNGAPPDDPQDLAAKTTPAYPSAVPATPAKPADDYSDLAEFDRIRKYNKTKHEVKPTPETVPVASTAPEPDEPVDMSQVKNISTDKIVPNPFQPRKVFDPHSLQELGDSIAEHGIIQPLVVTDKGNGEYELVAGERRLQASKLIGLKTVPAIVRKKELKDEHKLELAIIENVQREDLNLIEQARAYRKLHDEFGYSVDEISVKIGKSRPVVSNVMRMLNLPVEIQRALMDGKLAEGHGRAILQVADREKQFALFNLIQEKKLTTDQAFAMAKEWTARPYLRKNIRQKSDEVKAIEQQLQSKLDIRRVEITTSENGGGYLQVYFLSQDEFQRLIEKLNSVE